MAEIEFAALSKQCLGRRIGSMARLRKEVAAWEEERNERMVEVKWQFTKAGEEWFCFAGLWRLMPDGSGEAFTT